MGNTSFKISQFDNVYNRAADQAAGDSIGIQVHPDINCIPFNNRHIAIKDIVMTTIAHMDAERLERIRRDEISDLFCCIIR
jgi:hypothetical protein